jgi:ABC-type sugar transport system ATPase subunit
MMSTPEPVLEVRSLSKTFPGQVALDDVSLTVRRGEVHALLGENGSGKSTLIKCVTGVHQPDAGASIALGGSELSVPYTSEEALRAGCACTHQDLGLVPTLTVMENLALSGGFRSGLGGRIRWRAQRASARAALSQFADHVSPDAVVGELSRADQTLVAIVRSLEAAREGAQLLILDEPTAALPAHEVEALFASIGRLKDAGLGILYVSHRLPEIFEIGDRVTVLRNGSKVGTHEVAELDEARLVELILGRSLDTYYPPVERTARPEVLLSVRGLSGRRLQDVSFDVHAGEVLGIAGLLGSGRSELGRLLFGAQRRTGGEIQLGPDSLALASPREGIEAGIALIPEDRAAAGSHPTLTVRENITLVDTSAFERAGRLGRRAERKEVDRLIQRFGVRPPHSERRFATLSGGNQQKAILAKWMRLDPRLLILDEPVQGVDIGSRTEIYTLIEQATQAGTGVVLIDSELEDLCRLCDRVLVLDDGRLVRELRGDERTSERILEIVLTGGAA